MLTIHLILFVFSVPHEESRPGAADIDVLASVLFACCAAVAHIFT